MLSYCFQNFIVLMLLSCGLVFVLFGIHWMMPRTVVDLNLIACRQWKFGRHCNGVIWKAVPHCFMWCSWRKRNWSFEDLERNLPDLKLFFSRMDVSCRKSLFIFGFWFDRCLKFECLTVYLGDSLFNSIKFH